MAGAKGNPPRLADEESTFERKPTNNWAPGTPADVPHRHPGSAGATQPIAEHHAAAMPPTSVAPLGPSLPAVARVPAAQAATYIPYQPTAEVVRPGASGAPAMIATVPSNPGLRKTPVPMPAERARTRTPSTPPGRGTALGYQSGAGAQSAVVRLGLSPAVSQLLTRLVNRTVPADFQISKFERQVLNAIGDQGVITARSVGQMLGVADPVGWMEQLVTKLEQYGLDIVEPGAPQGGEPTYVLRR
jgi:hypothetical protein